jgi:maltose/moltooligosaccharide transporter
MQKPRRSFFGLCRLSVGFFGIQIGFALQNANMSRVFQSLGSSVDNLSALWVAAPLTGLLVQPIIGHMSDRTWLGRFGRRRPYFLAGAVLASLALLGMPQASGLLGAALLLWLLDASINVAMEPFRAFVGDSLNRDQHAAGYAVQTAFIGAGAVVGSIFPFVLSHFGVSNVAAAGAIPDTVRISFYAGAAAMLIAVLATVVGNREYSPAEMAAFGDVAEQHAPPVDLVARGWRPSLVWLFAGLAVVALVPRLQLQKEVYLLGGLLAGYGVVSLLAWGLARGGRGQTMLASIVGDFAGMPVLMKRLALVQFFSWSALFVMWIYSTPVVAQAFYGTADPASEGYQAAGNWVGVLFTCYNAVAALFSLTLLPRLARALGNTQAHALCLFAGALGLGSFLVLHDPVWLIASEVGVGMAWASILGMPYTILASSLPQAKLGVYMGLFNIFIVVPQLLVSTVMGSILKLAFPGQPVWTLAFAAGALVIAAACSLRLGAISRAA